MFLTCALTPSTKFSSKPRHLGLPSKKCKSKSFSNQSLSLRTAKMTMKVISKDKCNNSKSILRLDKMLKSMMGRAMLS